MSNSRLSYASNPAPSSKNETHNKLNLRELSFNVNIIASSDLIYTQKDKIGEGSFGVVYQGRWKHGDKVAIKQLQGELDEKGILEFKKEAALMAQLN